MGEAPVICKGKLKYTQTSLRSFKTHPIYVRLSNAASGFKLHKPQPQPNNVSQHERARVSKLSIGYIHVECKYVVFTYNVDIKHKPILTMLILEESQQFINNYQQLKTII